MGEGTKIQWADNSWSPWRGCEKVSEGCAHCYAEAMSVRNPAVLGTWGKGGKRPPGNAAYWRKPYRWDRKAADSGQRLRVFCGSLMDFFEDRDDLSPLRERALMTAYECHHLDWLFLTKRPENAPRLLARARHLHAPRQDWWTLQRGAPRPNWWFGCTAENVRRLRERHPRLLAVPAALRFYSCEPLLEDVAPALADHLDGVGWVIVGGESNQGGAQARPCDLAWVEGVVTVCRAAGVPCFVKQLGSRPLADGLGLRLLGRHGGDEAEWPDWMRVREVPSP